MLQLSVSADYDFHAAEFVELFEKADVTAFQHPAWQSAMQAHINALPGIEGRVLQLRCADTGTLVGLIPLIARRKMGATILEYANLGLVDYAYPTLHPDFWNWVPNARSLSEQLTATLGTYDMLRIKHMPTNDPAILRLFPNSYMERADFSAYAVDLTDDYDAWRLEAISKGERKSRDKKRRAMMRAGDWQMTRLEDCKAIETAFEHMRAFHAVRYADRPGEDMIQDPNAFRFYVDLTCKHAADGFARMYQFTYDDKIVAVQFGIVHQGCYYYLMMGIDYDAMGRFSPGLLMTEDIIRDCIKDGLSKLDLTVGDEPYKLKFGTTKTPIYTLWHAHSMLGAVGRTVADIVHKQPISERLRRWVS